MESLFIEGGVPLNGPVEPSGSPISATKLILASLFTSEEVVLENVPRVDFIQGELELLKSLGASCTWVGENRLVLNTSGVDSAKVPYDPGASYRTTLLLVPPLVFRFGKAIIPKPSRTHLEARPIDSFIEVWEKLGFLVKEDSEWLNVEAGEPKATNISFKSSTHMGTENAILSSLFIPGTTTINNAAEEVEIEDLIGFLTEIGADVKRVEPRRIEVVGQSLFKGGSFTVQSDKNEAVHYAVAALVTGGTVTIKNINRLGVAPFLNVLNKMGTNYEFENSDLTVWHAGEELQPLEIVSKPAPGFLTDWIPPLTLLLTQASGESVVHETIYPDRWGFARDLNRMGASIELLEGADAAASLEGQGDTVGEISSARIAGQASLKGVTLDITSIRSGPSLMLAALAADGKSELRGYGTVERIYGNFVENLANLGARFSS